MCFYTNWCIIQHPVSPTALIVKLNWPVHPPADKRILIIHHNGFCTVQNLRGRCCYVPCRYVRVFIKPCYVLPRHPWGYLYYHPARHGVGSCVADGGDCDVGEGEGVWNFTA